MNAKSQLIYNLLSAALEYYKANYIIFHDLSHTQDMSGNVTGEARFSFQSKNNFATRKMYFVVPEEIEEKHIYRALFELKSYGTNINLS